MTLAPPRPQHAPSDPGGVEPTVTAVVVTRRDPRGLADLLEAVLTQSHPPDAVLVLDRTAGATLPDPAVGIPARPVSPDDAPSAASRRPCGHRHPRRRR